MSVVRHIRADEIADLDLDLDRLASMLAYASPQFESVARSGDRLALTFAGTDDDLDAVLTRLRRDVGPARARERVLAERDHAPVLAADTVWERLLAEGLVWPSAPGRVAYLGHVLELIDALDRLVLDLAAELAPVEVRLPAMVPIELLDRLGSFDHHPHSLWFTAPLARDLDTLDAHARSDDRGDPEQLGARLGPPACALKVSACSLLYPMLEGARVDAPRVYSVLGTCSRCEGPAVATLERLSEFSMRELVYVGPAHALENFEAWSRQVFEAVLDGLDLGGRIATASDSFFVAQYSRYRVAQLLGGDKQELQVTVAEDRPPLAVGSYNRHRSYFTDRFAISGATPVVTACLGFGLERLALAALCHSGLDWVGIRGHIERTRRAWRTAR